MGHNPIVAVKLLLHCNGRHLDLRSADQARYLYGGARGLRVRHKLFVDFVHLRHVIEICDVHRHGRDVRHLKTSFLDYFFDGGNGVCGLQRDVGSRDLAVCIGTLLACYVERVARHVSLGEGHALLEVDGSVLGKSTAYHAQCQDARRPAKRRPGLRIPLLHVRFHLSILQLVGFRFFVSMPRGI